MCLHIAVTSEKLLKVHMLKKVFYSLSLELETQMARDLYFPFLQENAVTRGTATALISRLGEQT